MIYRVLHYIVMDTNFRRWPFSERTTMRIWNRLFDAMRFADERGF